MKVITIKTKVYKFEELSEEAKQNAIEKLYAINVDYEWYHMDDMYNEIAKEYGLKIKMNDVCFDLDRGNYLYFETYNHGSKKDYVKGIYIDDDRKFFKKAGLNLRLKRIKEAIINYDITVDHTHGGGGYGFNCLDISYDSDLTDDDVNQLENCLKEFIEEILDSLKKDYEYLTSEEAIIDTIEANDYDFTVDGELF